MIADLQQQLGIDSSFFQQFAIFVFAFLWMRIVFFSPFLELMLKRENQSDGMAEEAKRLEEESMGLESRYTNTLAESRKKISLERDAALAAIRKESAGRIEAARAKAKEKLEQSRLASNKSALAEFDALEPHVASLASSLVNKLMNTKVGL